MLASPFAHGEQDYFGKDKEPTGLIGNLYDLKSDAEREPTDVVGKNGGVDAKEFYEAFAKLIKKGFSEKDLEEYYMGDEQCNFEYMAIRSAAADKVPEAFGSSYIEPKGVIVLYEGVIGKAPKKEFRFAGFFDDAVAVLVNGDLVFYNAYQDFNRLKPEERSKAFKETGSIATDAYGKYITLKEGDKIQIAFAEVPGGGILGALKVQLKTFNYDEDQYDDPILHPFVARKVDKDLEEELASTRVKFEQKRVPEFIFKKGE
ncbi:hypothetical protein [Rubritalea sp.]|uniref:hypothetical protein n=1 Tax=Rubritalea sp. TaxID=2109375 RepID=UPI003EF9654F